MRIVGDVKRGNVKSKSECRRIAAQTGRAFIGEAWAIKSGERWFRYYDDGSHALFTERAARTLFAHKKTAEEVLQETCECSEDFTAKVVPIRFYTSRATP